MDLAAGGAQRRPRGVWRDGRLGRRAFLLLGQARLAVGRTCALWLDAARALLPPRDARLWHRIRLLSRRHRLLRRKGSIPDRAHSTCDRSLLTCG
eukprot:6205535-Pleurochrysis_carterae.AAC.2